MRLCYQSPINTQNITLSPESSLPFKSIFNPTSPQKQALLWIFSFFFHHRLVSAVLELYINRFAQYMFSNY